MNRKQLLAFLAKQGYKGASVLADIKAWIAEQNATISDPSGEEVDVDAAWATKAALTVDDASTKAHEADEDPDSVTVSTAELNRLKAAARVENQKVRGTNPPRNPADAPAIHTGNDRFARKSYQGKIARGEAKFGDVDQAEYVGATLRLASMAPFGTKSYRQRESDEAIVANVVGKTGSSTNNSIGGFLIPDDVSMSISWATEASGIARRLFNVQRMTRDTWSGNRKTAMISMTHRAQSGSMTATDDTLDRINLIAKEVYALVRLPTSLLEDSAVSIAEEYSKSFAEAQGRREDQDAFIGDGSATYGGHVGLANALRSGAYIAQATSNTWAAQVEADHLKLMGSVENVDTKRLAFLCSRQYYVQVMLRLALGKSGNNARDTREGLGMLGADAVYLGHPVFFSPDLPIITATTAKSVYFGDFQGGATLGDRRDLTVSTSEHAYFTTDEYAIKATARIAVNVHSDGRSGTFGNIVCLKNG